MFQGFLSLINFGNNKKKMKRSFGKNVFSAVEITRSPIAVSFLSTSAFYCPCKEALPQTSPVHVILQETGNISEPGNNDSYSIRYNSIFLHKLH